ncbi:MAG: hypothetical protein L0Y76_00800, partial [Ignavibacteria bacterium]|nr:hypothetical protein [Ignavibacteria bacterium]
MRTIALFFITALIALSLTACGQKEQEKTRAQDTKEKKTEVTKEQADFTGSYVSDGYDKRNEGYDWVGLTVKRI